MSHFVITLGCEYGSGGPDIGRMIAAQFDVIRKFAEKSSCLIIGRCSDYILKDRDDCLNIFVYAPESMSSATAPWGLSALISVHGRSCWGMSVLYVLRHVPFQPSLRIFIRISSRDISIQWQDLIFMHPGLLWQ